MGPSYPLLMYDNIGQLKATARQGLSRKKSNTPEYQQFRDTAVAIVTSFSAAGGAMRLIASDNRENHPEHQACLGRIAEGLLAAIERCELPWSKVDMAACSPYTRQIEAEGLSSSVLTEKKVEADHVHILKGGNYNIDQWHDDHAQAFAQGQISDLSQGQQMDSIGVSVNRTIERAKVPDDVTDPGQTGTTTWTTDTYRKPGLPLKDLRQQKTTEGRIRESLLRVLTCKREFDYTQTRRKEQGYTATQEENTQGARQFTAYRSRTEWSERSTSIKVGGNFHGASLHIGHGENKDRYELKDFTYGNDVGAMAIIMTKLLSDNDIQPQVVEGQVEANLLSGRPLAFFDGMDERVANAFLGDREYDHMSAILSKFRNSAFAVATREDGSERLQAPQVDPETGMAIAAIIPSELQQQLHNSKGQQIDLSATTETADGVPAKKYVDRSGFFGYALARYNNDLIQDAYQHWAAEYGVDLPSTLEVDALLSTPVDQLGQDGQPLTRQQWLKQASVQERRDFYQGHPQGQEMLSDYLKVVSLAASINDTIFQNNTYTMAHDAEQVARLNTYFEPPANPAIKP